MAAVNRNKEIERRADLVAAAEEAQVRAAAVPAAVGLEAQAPVAVGDGRGPAAGETEVAVTMKAAAVVTRPIVDVATTVFTGTPSLRKKRLIRQHRRQTERQLNRQRRPMQRT